MAEDALTPYWLYLLECEGDRLYAGIALDVEERFTAHVLGVGAKFTRAFPPLRVAAARSYPTKGEALAAEYALKQLPRAHKLGFFQGSELASAYRPPAGRPRQRG